MVARQPIPGGYSEDINLPVYVFLSNTGKITLLNPHLLVRQQLGSWSSSSGRISCPDVSGEVWITKSVCFWSIKFIIVVSEITINPQSIAPR